MYKGKKAGGKRSISTKTLIILHKDIGNDVVVIVMPTCKGTVYSAQSPPERKSSTPLQHQQAEVKQVASAPSQPMKRSSKKAGLVTSPSSATTKKKPCNKTPVASPSTTTSKKTLVASPSPQKRSKVPARLYKNAGLSDSLVTQLALDILQSNIPYNQVTISDIFKSRKLNGQSSEDIYGRNERQTREKFRTKLRQIRSFSRDKWNSFLFKLKIQQQHLPSAQDNTPVPQGPSCEPSIILESSDDNSSDNNSLAKSESPPYAIAATYGEDYDTNITLDKAHPSYFVSSAESSLCEELENVSLSKSKASVTMLLFTP
jgi:hypothetical protein